MRKSLLSLVLLSTLTSCSINISGFKTEVNYEKSELYSFGEKVFTETISKIEVDFISGEMNIKNGESFSINEEGEPEELYAVHHLIEDEKLLVHDTGCGKLEKSNYIKNVELNVNKQIDELNVNAASINFTSEIDVKNVKIDSVAGNFTITSQIVESLEINVVSGNITVYIPNGKTVKIKEDSISSNIKGDYEVGDDIQIDLNCVSANLTILKMN